mmetsp:Transcript_39035/g.82090  ORF Transcript_39035/g.82090 Transcript_39035/m.82090 type:complete len:340 (-) Transcript_39035:83-1102(-)
MTNQAPASPQSKKKKTALPTILSGIRNAQAAIGRAADELQERENFPLMGGGGSSRMAAPSNHPQLHRSAPSSSLSSSIHNFSQRFGSQWRKRGRRKKGQGVTIVPQSFFVAVGCFFVAFPVIFVIYALARHAVFGDEGDDSVTKKHIHEVPSAFSSGYGFESGKELLELNGMDQPTDEIGKDVEGIGEEEKTEEEKTEEETVLAQPETSDTEGSGGNDVMGEINRNETVMGNADQSQSQTLNNPVVETVAEEATITKDANAENQINNSTGVDGGNLPTTEEVKPQNELEGEKRNLEQGENMPSSIETAEADASSGQEKEVLGETMANENYLRGSQDENK